ncbi:MAG: L,D-transpeptidase family protein [Gammaproteobacteria bacterium]|nr:L,D-transpeptidase family protein [Gammaproteobacteria bacterium]
MIKASLHLWVLLLFLVTPRVNAELHPEQQLLQVIDAIQTAQMQKAEQQLKQLIAREPEFKLAHLLYADLMKVHANPLKTPGMGLEDNNELQPLLTEVKNRWLASNLDEYNKKIPSVLTRLDGNYLYALAVDLKLSRLFVFENFNEQPRQIADYFISMGRGGPQKEKQGDLRTPLGVYFVQSYIPPQKLADKYGAGAYPINYPNVWDSFNGRTGYGIWLHGTRSGTYNRPPLASEGCVVLPNEDLLAVGGYITLGQTPVLIGYDLKWLSIDQWKQQKEVVSSLFNQWLTDWQSLDTDSYLRHYSRDFNNGKKDFTHWVNHKRRVAKHKTFVSVETSDVSLLMHPNEDVMVATFLQNYTSDNYSSESWKRQYWRKEKDGQWRIIFEGGIDAPSMQQLARREL